MEYIIASVFLVIIMMIFCYETYQWGKDKGKEEAYHEMESVFTMRCINCTRPNFHALDIDAKESEPCVALGGDSKGVQANPLKPKHGTWDL